jgi:hypothetical protein
MLIFMMSGRANQKLILPGATVRKGFTGGKYSLKCLGGGFGALRNQSVRARAIGSVRPIPAAHAFLEST